ncbi:PQQ-binding-like beta-propeller repeat protein [Streptomyces sp. LP11]|uniref:PQQ-binding-like beta-propeller repeat protein n=1 Tax=Streptomyces pyxinicus TaxID=2970331 RepID=A0ABT2BD87_9ACTN|nr:PQQ-binding-like beta-propeller repeat protein [Streptomyces sp. LP11]
MRRRRPALVPRGRRSRPGAHRRQGTPAGTGRRTRDRRESSPLTGGPGRRGAQRDRSPRRRAVRARHLGHRQDPRPGRRPPYRGLSDRPALWNTTLATSRCHDTGYAGGRALLALVTCRENENTAYRVEKLDPRTGKAQWRYPVSKGIQDVYLPSADPPVVAVAAGDTLVTDLITLDPKTGEQRARIPMRGYEPDCGAAMYPGPFFGTVDKCYGVMAGRDRIFVTSEESDEIREPANHITAFDPVKGTAVARFDGRPSQKVLPVRANGDDLIVFRDTPDDVQPAAVVDWNPRTDKETPYLLFHLPEDDANALGDPEQSDIRYEQGNVFFARRTMERDDEHPKGPVLSVIGVGSAGLEH